MADKKLTAVTEASSTGDSDYLVLLQSNMVKKIAIKALQLGGGSTVKLELRKYNNYVQWRADSLSSWQNLFPLSDVTGEDGITPSFSIGTVKTVENGQPASVTISGTSTNVILNFSIPKGLNGTGAGDVTTDQLNAAIQGLNIPRNLSDLLADSTHRTVTDAEKSSWNNKSNLTETRVNQLIDAKLPRSAEEVQY